MSATYFYYSTSKEEESALSSKSDQKVHHFQPSEDIITKCGKYNIKLSNIPFYDFYHFLLILSKYLHYVNISTSYTVSFFKCSLRVLRTFPLFFNDVELLQGALCVFKFKVWKFQSKIIHYLPFQNKMKLITQRSESIRATSIHCQGRCDQNSAFLNWAGHYLAVIILLFTT